MILFCTGILPQCCMYVWFIDLNLKPQLCSDGNLKNQLKVFGQGDVTLSLFGIFNFFTTKSTPLVSLEGYNDIGRMSGRWYDDMMIWYDDMMIWWYHYIFKIQDIVQIFIHHNLNQRPWQQLWISSCFP